MSPTIELNLTLILFLPWLLLLGWGYVAFPRQPRDRARRLYDALALIAAFGGFLGSMYWSLWYADPAQGRLWRQILATAVSYGVLLILLGIAFTIRGAWLARRARARRAAPGGAPTPATRSS